MANDSALEQRIQNQLGSNKAIIIVKTILGNYYKKKRSIVRPRQLSVVKVTWNKPLSHWFYKKVIKNYKAVEGQRRWKDMICIANYFCHYSVATQQWKLFSSAFRSHPEFSLSAFRSRPFFGNFSILCKSGVLFKAYSTCRIKKCLCTEIYDHRIVYIRHSTEFCLTLPLSSASDSKNLCTTFRSRCTSFRSRVAHSVAEFGRPDRRLL